MDLETFIRSIKLSWQKITNEEIIINISINNIKGNYKANKSIHQLNYQHVKDILKNNYVAKDVFIVSSIMNGIYLTNDAVIFTNFKDPVKIKLTNNELQILLEKLSIMYHGIFNV